MHHPSPDAVLASVIKAAWFMVNTPDYALLASRYLRDQDVGDKLRQTASLVAHMRRDDPPRPASRRRIDIETAAKRIFGALAALRTLDQWILAEAILRGIGPMSDQTPAPLADDLTSPRWQGTTRHEALVEATAMMARMDTIQRGLFVLGGEAAVPQGRPERPDPAVFGVEALASIWRATRGTHPTRSFKDGGFGAMCLDLLTCPPAQFPETIIRQAVRQVLSRQLRGAKDEPRG